MRRTPDRRLYFVALLTALVVSAGCGSIGPRTLDRDQIDYGESIGGSWKNQLLANIVKSRYLDMPVFIDVGQIVSGYTLETSVSGSLDFVPGGGDNQSLGASGRFTDRPTITFTPKTGDDYLRSLLVPVDPGALLSLVAAGYNPALLFTWAVESVNGVQNLSAQRGEDRAADPDYLELVDLLVDLSRRDAIAFEVRSDPTTGQDSLLVFSNENRDPEVASARNRLREILGLSPELNEFRVVYARVALGSDALALETRSIIQMIQALARFVDVPAEKAASAGPSARLAGARPRPFTVRTSAQRPTDPFAVVRYRGDWYWIDHEDLLSKRIFTVMLFLTTLTSQGGASPPPILTIPTN